MSDSSIPHRLNLHADDWVQVRSKEEILSTLDKNGRLGEMPFMPEMFQHCGKKYRVGKRAHKTCDPMNGLESRRLPDTVHLEGLRCDGSAHAGCQAGCLFYFKEAWLKKVDEHASESAATPAAPQSAGKGATEDEVLRGTIASVQPEGAAEPIYCCQATQVQYATTPIKWYDPTPYIEDYKSGNASLWRIFCAFVFWIYHEACGLGIGLGSAMRWAYDTFQKMIGGVPYPWRVGRVAKGQRTPTCKIDVKEGEMVRIKDYDEILDTLDEEWKNRGLYFDAEMVPFTNGTYKVLKRVDHIIDEKTGKMLHFKNECLILDEVVCQARFAKCRKLCPRAYYLYWREIWVERVSGANGKASEKSSVVQS